MLTPGEQLILDLEMLRRKLNGLHERLNDSGVERTFHMRRIMGSDCELHARSMNFFLGEDYEDIREQIIDIQDTIDVVEGKVPNGK